MDMDKIRVVQCEHTSLNVFGDGIILIFSLFWILNIVCFLKKVLKVGLVVHSIIKHSNQMLSHLSPSAKEFLLSLFNRIW
jgi:hypothetical protein